MNRKECLDYIHSITWTGTMPKLDRTRELMDRIGHPERRLRFIHVAGTNGKGSTCAMLASILQKAGYRTGLYTSPYLFSFNERIQVDGVSIPDEVLIELTEWIRPHADAMVNHPSEFEVITAIAMAWFARMHCDIVVLEVGLGGEFDATNIIERPEVSVITRIGLDHTQILGDTAEAIARAKAGIIKEGCDVVVYQQEPGVEAVLRTFANARHAPWHRAEMQFLAPISDNLDGQHFSFKQLNDLFIPLSGEHQLHNAATVLTTVEVLRLLGWRIPDDAITEGLRSVVWPGRFQIVSRKPMFIVDGGHNPQCIAALSKTLEHLFPGKRHIFITGCMADKDYATMFEPLYPLSRLFIAVTPPNPRALDARKLSEALARAGCPSQACQTVKEGVRHAFELAGSDGSVCACGSLYMIADVLQAFRSL